MAILIVVIGMLGTTVWGQYRKALIRTATVQVQDKLTNALELFYLDFKRYPDQNYEGLYILADIDNPNAPQQQQPQQQQGMQGQQGMQSPNGMMDGMYGATGGMGGDMNAGMYGTNGNMGGDMTGGMNGMGGDMSGMGGNMNGMQQPQQQVYKRPKIVEPYIKEQDLKDPWNQPYRYEWPTTKGDVKKPAVWSCGPDKEDNNGDGDDVINWDPEDTSGLQRMQNNQMPTNPNGMMQPGMTNPGMNDPNMMNPGMNDPNMMNPGMTNPGMNDPNMMNPGMNDPNMMNPGMMNPGMNDPNMMNPGGMNPGGMNPGVM
jgi:hypothetical protein